MKHARLLFCFTICIIGFTGCKKDKAQPNEIVTINNMNFGCKVDGQPFIADLWDYGNNMPPLKIKMLHNSTYNYTYMWVRADKSNSQVSLYVNPPLTVGKKLLNSTTSLWPLMRPKDYGMYSIFTPSVDYMTSETVKGYIDIITVDTIQRKIEARFEFEAIDKQSGKKVTVTNGYFKLK